MAVMGAATANRSQLVLFTAVVILSLGLIMVLLDTYPARAAVHVTSMQQPAPRCLHGTQMLGACFCDPGWIGRDCSRPDVSPPGACSSTSDMCFVHRSLGVCKVSEQRWKQAQAAELTIWKEATSDNNDRVQDHMAGYDSYNQVPPFLGNVMEVGCGPWTQLGFMLDKRSTWVVDNITLWEPSAADYQASVPNCAYKDGKLRGRPVRVVSKGAEEINGVEEFDTIMLTNVLEHVQDVYAILSRIYTALRPGGILIFHDRWWDTYDYTTPVSPTNANGLRPLDHMLHPIRCSRRVFEHFLGRFEPWHKSINHEAVTKYTKTFGWTFEGVYFIGMKKM